MEKKTISGSAFPLQQSISHRTFMSRLRCRRPLASWPKTKTFAFTAASAPSDAPRRRGTCKSLNFLFPTPGGQSASSHACQRKRFRNQISQRQRNRIGQRQWSAYASHFSHGYSGLRQESFPVEYSGTADLV